MDNEAWINGPVGATVRRGLAFLVGLSALLLNKYLNVNVDAATQAGLVTLVLGYIGQSYLHSRAKAQAAS